MSTFLLYDVIVDYSLFIIVDLVSFFASLRDILSCI